MAKKQTKTNKTETVTKVKEPNIMRAKNYRMKAIEIVKPMSGDFAVTYFVYEVIIAAIAGLASALVFTAAGMVIGSTILGLFTLLTSGAFSFSLIQFSKQARAKHEKPKVGGIFYGFKDRYGQSLGVYIIVSLFTTLWTLLLIVPGIIKSFSYSMSLYIAFDNPNKTVLECITESRKMMKGNKWKLFCLRISYIGWFILTILTLGILSFWVMPKFNQAQYEFYLHVSKKA